MSAVMVDGVSVESCGHPGPYGYEVEQGSPELRSARCYDCCAKFTKDWIRSAEPGANFVAYLSMDGSEVTDWPGSVLMRRVRFGRRHNRSHRRYFTAVDDLGRVWSGVGERGEYAPMRLTKVGSR